MAEAFAVSPVDMYLRANHRLASILPVLRATTCVSDVDVQESGLVAPGATRMGQDKFGGAHPERFKRVALGIVSGAGVRVYASGAW